MCLFFNIDLFSFDEAEPRHCDPNDHCERFQCKNQDYEGDKPNIITILIDGCQVQRIDIYVIQW